MSFLRRMLKHYRTKPNYNSEALVTSDKHGSSDEPEYETVDYSAPTLKHNNVEEELPEPSADSNSTESLHKELHKEKLFGTKSLLTEQALVELKMKLKGRDDIIKSASAVPASGDIDGYECISSDEVPEWKPVPTPRSSKQMSSQDNKGIVVQASSHQCNTSINRANKPPSLPPRRVARPCSPWHDVPKNNSPIYGNFQDLGITVGEKIEDKIKKAHEPTTEKQSICQASEWDQEFQDAILGTPHGFVYIQKKWKAAEKSGELCHDQQGTKGKTLFPKSSQHRFPEKWSNVEEVQEKHMRSACDNSAESDTVSCEQRTVAVCVTDTFSSDIYSDVKKRHSSAKTIIKSFNLQTGKVTEKASDLSNTDKKVDNELTCIKGKTGEVNDSELKCNNSEVKVGSTKTEHHDTSGDRTHNYKNNNSKDCDINTTYHKDHPNDTIVTLRKSQSGLVSMCNKYEVLFNETENCGVVVNGENESFYSSQLHSETHTKGVKEETEDRAYAIKNNSVCSDCSNISTDYSAQGRIKTPFNTTCNQNILRSGTKDLCNRVVDDVEAAGYEDILPRLNRHSDELNLLLAQLAEITSAPLLPQGAATSLVDIPDGKKPKPQTDDSSQLGPTPPESSVLGPIRRRRHSDPDYDVPRPHGSLLHLLAPNRMSSHSSDHSQSRQENAIEATRFFGDVDLTSSSTYSSLSLRHSVISEVDDQSDTSYYVSMAPDSLEVPLNNDMEGSM